MFESYTVKEIREKYSDYTAGTTGLKKEDLISHIKTKLIEELPVLTVPVLKEKYCVGMTNISKFNKQ